MVGAGFAVRGADGLANATLRLDDGRTAERQHRVGVFNWNAAPRKRKRTVVGCDHAWNFKLEVFGQTPDLGFCETMFGHTSE
jgi:hypothetical protein